MRDGAEKIGKVEAFVLTEIDMKSSVYVVYIKK